MLRVSRSRDLQRIEKERERLFFERTRLRRERYKLRCERRDVAIAKADFEKRMAGFRKVCTSAWDAVLEPSKLGLLKEVLEKTDSLWEGFAGCVRDPDGRASLVKVA
jgi:hypothetical protein